MDELSEDDKLTVARARKAQRFMSQPFHVAEVFTGRGGRFVQLEDTIKGFQEILSGKLDHLPEGAFYMSGNIDEVKETAAKVRFIFLECLSAACLPNTRSSSPHVLPSSFLPLFPSQMATA